MAFNKYKTNPSTAVFLYDSYYEYLDYIERQREVIFRNPTSNAKRVWDGYFDETVTKRRLRSDGTDWWGTTDFDELTQELRTYQFSSTLIPTVENIQRQTLMDVDVNIQQKKQITFTSQEIGIFSFDLASLGLIRVFEYYSPLLKSFVDPNYVKSYKTGTGSIVFYHIYVAEIPEHILQQKEGKLFSPLLNRFVDKKNTEAKIDEDGSIYFVYLAQKEIPKHDVEQIQKTDENGQKVFSSTWKKSFIHIPPISKQLPQIDLISVASFSGNRTPENNMFWSAVAMNVLIQILEQSNIRFRVYNGIANEWSRTKKQIGFIRVKDINDALDRNIASILTADARSFRYNGFKWVLGAGYDNGADRSIDTSFGAVINDTNELKTAFIEALKQKKDWGSSMEDTLNPRTKVLLPSVTSRQGALDAIQNAIDQIKL